MHDQRCICIWEAAQSFSIAFLPPTWWGKSENTALLSNVSRVAAAPLMACPPVWISSCFRFPVNCGWLLSDLFVSCVTVARQAGHPHPQHPLSPLLLHRSRNLMNCTNLRLTSQPVFLSLGPSHHWGWVLHFHIRHTSNNTHIYTHTYIHTCARSVVAHWQGYREVRNPPALLWQTGPAKRRA